MTIRKNKELIYLIILIFFITLITLSSTSSKTSSKSFKNFFKFSDQSLKLYDEKYFSKLSFSLDQFDKKIKEQSTKVVNFKMDPGKRESLLLRMADSYFTFKKKVKEKKKIVETKEPITKEQILQNPENIKLVYKYARE